jgi:tRNA nucleotidyltransferase/poly(A) polymerase
MRPETIREWLSTEPAFREVASFVCRQGVEAYLVGGTVRDLLVGRDSYDMDLAVVGDALGLARRVADAVGGAYYPMDPERDVARVVVWPRQSLGSSQLSVGQRRAGALRVIDLAGLRAATIEEDLRVRDYTVNAMAVPLCSPERGLLDPTGGRKDLEARTLRATHSGAFDDDPLRLLRGVRLRQALGWEIAPETERLMRVWAPSLSRVSPERVRDELAQVLSLGGAAGGLAYAHGLGVLAPALAGVDGAALSGGIAVVGRLERLEPAWEPAGRVEDDVRALRTVLDDLGQWLRAHWEEELSGGRTRRVALKLAALLYALGDSAGGVAARLHLSAREVRLVAGAVTSAHGLREGGASRPPSRLAIYRYFRRAGEAGVAGAILALAADPGLDGPGREGLEAYAAALLRAWFGERREVIDPPSLLTGSEVMAELGIGPGPRVGEALEALREAQVQGLVATPEEARQYLRERRS